MKQTFNITTQEILQRNTARTYDKSPFGMECFYESWQPRVHSATTAFHLYSCQLTIVIYNEVYLFVTLVFTS